MSLRQRIYCLLMGFLLGCCCAVNAAKTGSNAVFLLTPQSSPEITISYGETKTVSYLIQNNPKNPNTLTGIGVVNLPQGVSWVSGGSCSLPVFTLASGASCTVMLQVDGSKLARSFHGGPQISGTARNRVYNSQPSLANQLYIIKSKTNSPQLQAALTAIATPTSIEFGATSTLSTTGGSGSGAVTYAVTTGASNCSISGTTLTGIGVGSCSVTATKAGDVNYQPTTSSPITITVSQGQQATLTAIATPTSIEFGATSTLSTTGGSGSGAVTYAVTTGASNCSISGTTLTGIGVGSCSVTATKAGDVNYQPTTSSPITITVSQGQQATLTAIATPTSIEFGATSTLSTTGGSGSGAVTYAVTTGASNCSISGTTLTGIGVGSCSVTATKAGDVNYQPTTSSPITITVSQGQQATLTAIATPTSIGFGATSTLSTTGGSGSGAVTYAVTTGAGNCSISGTTLTGIGVGSCSVTATKAGDVNYQPTTSSPITLDVIAFPVAEGPNNVFAIPGNGQAAVSWTAPNNIGTGTITGYTVTYGPTSGTTFTTAGCTATVPSLTCTVTGLTNGTAYTFAVSTITQQSGVSQTGPTSFSSSITPINGLAISPSTLALSSLNSSHIARVITLTNTSNAPIMLTNVPSMYNDFTPDLPSDVTINTTCSTSTALTANGGSCIITITPGTTASNDASSSACTGGSAPVLSAFEVITGSSINAVVLGYGCEYQGGYIFSIDDTTSTTQSIGGKVVATTDQAASAINWSPGGVNSIWGIDDTSTSASPSPNASSSQPATFKPGQLNCDAVNGGACATHNIQIFYNSSGLGSYAAGLCRQPLTGATSSTPCAGGSDCHTDWYLPSTCDLGPFGSTGSSGDYPSSAGSQSCTLGSTNIQMELVSSSIISISGDYWSSTESSAFPLPFAWFQTLINSGDNQDFITKTAALVVRCVRDLTN